MKEPAGIYMTDGVTFDLKTLISSFLGQSESGEDETTAALN